MEDLIGFSPVQPSSSTLLDGDPTQSGHSAMDPFDSLHSFSSPTDGLAGEPLPAVTHGEGALLYFCPFLARLLSIFYHTPRLPPPRCCASIVTRLQLMVPDVLAGVEASGSSPSADMDLLFGGGISQSLPPAAAPSPVTAPALVYHAPADSASTLLPQVDAQSENAKPMLESPLFNYKDFVNKMRQPAAFDLVTVIKNFIEQNQNCTNVEEIVPVLHQFLADTGAKFLKHPIWAVRTKCTHMHMLSQFIRRHNDMSTPRYHSD